MNLFTNQTQTHRHRKQAYGYQREKELEINIYTVEYYTTIRKNEIMPFAATWMDLENILLNKVSSVQFSCLVVYDSWRPHESQHARPPYPLPAPGVYPNSCSIESVMPSSHLNFCRPLLLLPPIPPSTRVFSSKSTLRIRWPQYWSFSFSISPSNEHPGLISFRMYWLDLLADRKSTRLNSSH